MNDLHFIQIAILLELGKQSSLSFSDFSTQQKHNLPKDKFNYHLQTLVKHGYIEKVKLQYKLSSKGKLVVTNFNFDTHQIEEGPRLKIMARIFKTTSKEKYILVSKRLKHPFLNHIGVVTGKIQKGESFKETLFREVSEETGLTPTEFELVGMNRWLDYDKEKQLVGDSVFIIFNVLQTTGKLLKTTNESENKWVKLKELRKENLLLPSLKAYMNEDKVENKLMEFEEKISSVEKF